MNNLSVNYMQFASCKLYDPVQTLLDCLLDEFRIFLNLANFLNLSLLVNLSMIISKLRKQPETVRLQNRSDFIDFRKTSLKNFQRNRFLWIPGASSESIESIGLHLQRSSSHLNELLIDFLFKSSFNCRLLTVLIQ